MAATTKKAKGPVANIIELILTVGVAVGLALIIQAFLVKPYRIPSGSMIPTLAIGQRILVNRLDTHPALGDVVVFHPPTGAVTGDGVCGDPAQGVNQNGTPHRQACDRNLPTESNQTFVKRVVGLPHDHLRIIDGYVWRNGKKETGAYIQHCLASTGAACTFRRTIVVPSGEYYMMGDNRGDSLDSRYWGPEPQRWIIGVAFFTYWPINRIGFF
ncbi:MAG TPA: signal peptidase I [Solirubrobacteraceae bacterium]|nr:signal peptidase I [Solirubrobacteraceae bacterium]